MNVFIIASLVIYIPFHLFEEAIGDFPKWMYDHKWLPHHMTHGLWMAKNIFIYYPMLLIALALYIFGGKLFLCCGIGILIWGVINFGDHFFYTINDRKVSPGLITGALFLLNSIMGFMNLTDVDTLTIILSVLIGGILFGAPIGLSVVLHDTFDKYMK